MGDVCGLEPVNKPVPTCATHFGVMNLTSLPKVMVCFVWVEEGYDGSLFGVVTDRSHRLDQKSHTTLSLSVPCHIHFLTLPLPPASFFIFLLVLLLFPQFLLQIAGYGHGPMHVNVGGVFGQCTEGMQQLYSDYEPEMKQVNERGARGGVCVCVCVSCRVNCIVYRRRERDKERGFPL